MPDADAHPTTSATNPTPGPDAGADAGADGADLHEIFAEVLTAGAVLDELDDAARVEAWASSALGVWAEAPDAADHDEEFSAWLAEVVAAGGPLALRAQHVRAAVCSLRPHLGEAGEMSAGVPGSVESSPPWLGHLGTATATRAWSVERHGVESVGIGFVSSDDSEHSLLADLVDGELAALIVAPGPDELFDGSEDLVAPLPLEVAEAGRRIVAAWRRLHRHGTATPESVHVNGALARARLTALTGDRFDDMGPSAGDPGQPPLTANGDSREVEHDQVDRADSDRAESDRWACSVLDGAIGPAPHAHAPEAEAVVDAVLDALVPERIERQAALEREAYGALEWADWLGVVIEVVRRGPGTHLDPEAMVDAVNRCPEVTSSIPRADRAYYAWAFSLVLALWRRAGVVDEQARLTSVGATALPAALRRAWGRVSSR